MDGVTHNALGTDGRGDQLSPVLQTDVERDVDAETANDGQHGRQDGLIYAGNSSVQSRERN